MKKKVLLTVVCIVMAAMLFGCGGVTAEKAVDIAYSATGVDASQAQLVNTYEGVTDAAGNEIVVVDFVNDGTEYICRIDAQKGQLISVDQSATGSSEVIESAKAAALSHAGLTADAVVFTKAHNEYDDGVAKCEIEFLSGGREYEYEINAKTMEVISADIDREDPVSAPTDGITADEAKEIALGHKGFSSGDVIFTKVNLDEDDGVMVYDIEFVKDRIEYEYEIHAGNGAILSAESDTEDADDVYTYVDKDGTNVNDTNQTTQSQAQSQTKTSSQGSSSANLISKDEAVKIAVKNAGYSVSDVKLTKSELDYDDGIAKYDIEFDVDGYEYDYEINAKTSAVIEKSKEKDDDYVKKDSSSTNTSGSSQSTGTDTGKNDNAKSETKEESSGITLSKAKSIALEDAGFSSSEVRFDTAKKDRDDGVSYYEIEFCKDGVEYSYEISMSGKIIERDIDRD